MTTLALGALSFSDTPDVNGSLVLTTSTGLSLGSILGTAGAITVTGSSSLVIDVADNMVMGGTAGFVMPVGTTAQRPATPVAGTERMNTTIGAPEVYNGTYWMPHGRVLQIASGNVIATTTTTVVTPGTAAPTQTGAQLFTTTFTPVSATSRVIVSFNVIVTSSAASAGVTISVFSGTVAKGVSVSRTPATAATFVTVPVQIEWVPGSTAAITISAYGVSHLAGTMYFNTYSTVYYAGLMVGQYTITEVA